jgi:hypothetical protein
VVVITSVFYELQKRDQRRELARELAQLRTFIAKRLSLPEPVRVYLDAPLRLQARLGTTVIRRDSQGRPL